jgi:hypothetical protein
MITAVMHCCALRCAALRKCCQYTLQAKFKHIVHTQALVKTVAACKQHPSTSTAQDAADKLLLVAASLYECAS